MSFDNLPPKLLLRHVPPSHDPASRGRDCHDPRLANGKRRVPQDAYEQSAAAYANVKTAFEKLEQTPLDPEANLTVGKFRCFLKGDWGNGLPMLTLGSDTILKSQAEKDLKGSKQPIEQVALGDGWWSISDGETSNAKEQIQRRAAYWYQQALPALAGLPKAKVEKRLNELASSASAEEQEPSKGKEIDVLKSVDPARHALGGKWLKNKENEVTGLRTTGDKPAPMIVLPASIKGDYEIETEFTRINRDVVSIVFPVAKTRTQFWLDFEGFGGLSTTESVDPRYNNTRTPLKLENGKRNKLIVSVSSRKPDEATITATLDGSPCFNWKGATKDLTVSHFQKWPDSVVFALFTHGDVAFHTFVLRPKTGMSPPSTRRSSSAKGKVNSGEPGDGHFEIKWESGWTFLVEIKGQNLILYGEKTPTGERKSFSTPVVMKYKFDAKKSTLSADNVVPFTVPVHLTWNIASGEAHRVRPDNKQIEIGKVSPGQ